MIFCNNIINLYKYLGGIIMAINPMQRRARNSFLIGFLVALIIMAVVVLLLLYKIQGLNEDFDNLKAKQRNVYVAADYIQSGTEVDLDSFIYDVVQTTLAADELISEEDFEYIDEETGEIIYKYDSEGNQKNKKMIVKTNVPAGSIITKDMLEEIDEQTTKDLRLQEYNMIILPSLLKNGDYVDIRLQLPEGEDYIVISKKKVIYTDATGIWMKLAEDEILTLGNAIVEAWTITGSKLYAITYTEPGRQDAATPTYPVSQATLNLINSDPNVLKQAKDGLWQRYNDQEQVVQRNDHINKALESNYSNMKESVEEGLEAEIEKLQEARQKYVEALESTGVVGTGIYSSGEEY